MKTKKRLVSIKEINNQKLDLIAGLLQKSVSEIVNELLETNKSIDELLEESKKKSNLL